MAAHRLRTKLFFAIIGMALLVIAIAVAVVVLSSRSVAVNIPQPVLDKVLFPIYVPSQLPNGYHVVEGSFSNNEGVLVYSVRSDAGYSIAVTEQSMPAGFDFTSFYNKQMADARKVDGATFPSVIGGVTNGTTSSQLLSVQADTTWVMASTQNAPRSDLEFIARHLRKFDK